MNTMAIFFPVARRKVSGNYDAVTKYRRKFPKLKIQHLNSKG